MRPRIFVPFRTPDPGRGGESGCRPRAPSMQAYGESGCNGRREARRDSPGALCLVRVFDAHQGHVVGGAHVVARSPDLATSPTSLFGAGLQPRRDGPTGGLPSEAMTGRAAVGPRVLACVPTCTAFACISGLSIRTTRITSLKRKRRGMGRRFGGALRPRHNMPPRRYTLRGRRTAQHQNSRRVGTGLPSKTGGDQPGVSRNSCRSVRARGHTKTRSSGMNPRAMGRQVLAGSTMIG